MCPGRLPRNRHLALVSPFSLRRVSSPKPWLPLVSSMPLSYVTSTWHLHQRCTSPVHHRQPGRRRSRQTHPRRHALRALGDGQQPEPPASIAARPLSRDGVRIRAPRAGALFTRRANAVGGYSIFSKGTTPRARRRSIFATCCPRSIIFGKGPFWPFSFSPVNSNS